MHISWHINVDVCLFPATSYITIVDRCDVGQATIDTLPDDVLLYVFDFYVPQGLFGSDNLTVTLEVETWYTLVRVCRRWRTLVFASPRRLNLRIACTDKTPVREKLGVWPRLPIVVSGFCRSVVSLDNIKAALEHHDRVCRIEVHVHNELEIAEVFAAWRPHSQC
jgi:F-box-like